MKQYKHIFDALVKVEQIEYLNGYGKWRHIPPELVLDKIRYGSLAENFRIKPKTININGHEVSEPVREPLEYKTIYYRPELSDRNLVMENRFMGNTNDYIWLSRGFIHLTREAAEAHAKALLSFTTVKE